VEPVVVEAVAGSCMLLWTQTFQHVGGFNPEYFMYAEDMDLCLKIRRAGLQVYHVPQAEILHHGGASSGAQGSKFSAVMMREALHTYMRLNHGWFSAVAYRLFTGGWGVLRLLLLLPRLLIARGERRRVVWASMSRWRSILFWSVGLERWTKQYRLAKRSDRHIGTRAYSSVLSKNVNDPFLIGHVAVENIGTNQTLKSA
jgi:GT2 family glycosyltransferase